jgi:hypothetical protein
MIAPRAELDLAVRFSRSSITFLDFFIYIASSFVSQLSSFNYKARHDNQLSPQRAPPSTSPIWSSGPARNGLRTGGRSGNAVGKLRSCATLGEQVPARTHGERWAPWDRHSPREIVFRRKDGSTPLLAQPHLQPTSAFFRFPPVRTTGLQDRLWVDSDPNVLRAGNFAFGGKRPWPHARARFSRRARRAAARRPTVRSRRSGKRARSRSASGRIGSDITSSCRGGHDCRRRNRVSRARVTSVPPEGRPCPRGPPSRPGPPRARSGHCR